MHALDAGNLQLDLDKPNWVMLGDGNRYLRKENNRRMRKVRHASSWTRRGKVNNWSNEIWMWESAWGSGVDVVSQACVGRWRLMERGETNAWVWLWIFTGTFMFYQCFSRYLGFFLSPKRWHWTARVSHVLCSLLFTYSLFINLQKEVRQGISWTETGHGHWYYR